MKKRKRERVLALILVFVLASVASVANATLITSVDPTGDVNVGDVVVVTVNSDVGENANWGVYLDPNTVFPASAQLQNATILAAAGSSGAVVAGLNPDAGHDYKSQGGGPGAPIAGDWSTVEFVGLAAGTYYVKLYDSAGQSGTVLDTETIVVLPEPATIALLGLGGLLLMRRRKIAT